MTMSVQMTRVHNLAAEYDQKLRADDPRFSGAVRVHDEDGSFFWFDYAFAVKHNDGKQEWLIVFTEHHDFHVFPIEGLLHYEARGPQLSIRTIALD